MKRDILGQGLRLGLVLMLCAAGCSKRPDAEASRPSAEVATEPAAQPEPTPPFESRPGDIVIDLAYRGLSGTDEDITYGWSMGMGRQDEGDEFLAQVRKVSPDCLPVYNSYFKDAEWSGLEMTGGRPSKLYMDLNANHRLDPNEAIAPLPPDPGDAQETRFVTPNFFVRTRDGRQCLMRVRLTASIYNEGEPPSCMWSPACILEGKWTSPAGTPQKVLLFAATLDGGFDRFGNSNLALADANQVLKGYVPDQTSLSRIMPMADRFYRVFPLIGGEDYEGSRIVLRRYDGQVGRLAVDLSDQPGLKTRLSGLRLVGSEDSGIVMNVQGGQTELPVGGYKVQSGTLRYGRNDPDEWMTQFQGDRVVTVVAGQTAQLTLSKPVLGIEAVDYDRRGYSDEKPRTEFKQGTKIYLTRTLTGQAGEQYTRLYRNTPEEPYQAAKPHLTVTDAKGVERVSADLEYG